MKTHLPRMMIILLWIVGLSLLYLTNTGVLSFDKPYIYQYSQESPTEYPPVAFVNVNVVPMDSERVLRNQTVIVHDNVIETIGDSGQVQVRAEAVVVDGTDHYLMPGLTDMHVHIEYENDMLLMVANGVTSVRNMWGNTGRKLWWGMPDQLELRRHIEAGALFGPTIYTAGPIMEGSPAFHPMVEPFDLPGEARKSVIWQAQQGFDFIKVYDHLSPEVYQAVMETAVANDIPVVGHVPFAVGLDGVLASGQVTIEHLAGYIDSDEATFIIPQDQLDDYAEKTREAGVWNVVTLSEYPKSKETPAGMERLQNQPGMVYVSPGVRFLTPFFYTMTSRSHTYLGIDYPRRMTELNRQMVEALHEAGAGILLGTDAAQAYHIPGFSIHEELVLLVDAGLTPYEAIEAGTRNAAVVMEKLDEFGTIEAGKRADMILLAANPLDDVGNIQKRMGVMLNGRWLTEAQLQAMLAGLVDSYKPSLLERLWPLHALISLVLNVYPLCFKFLLKAAHIGERIKRIGVFVPTRIKS